MDTTEQPKIYKSSIGNTVDIASPTSKKLQRLGLWWTIITILPILAINYIIYDLFTSETPILGSGDIIVIFGLLLMPLLVWFCLGNAVQRFAASSSEKRYFRAGAGGISVCIPDNTFAATMLFRVKTFEFDLAWDKIKTWYPYTQSINGIPVERSIAFETLDGKKFHIKVYNFAEKQEQIAHNLVKARTITYSNPLNESKEGVGESQVKNNSLPEGLSEIDIEIKQKKEPVRQIDLRHVAITNRLGKVVYVGDFFESYCQQLYPKTGGYKYRRKQFSPFQEQPQLFGIKIIIQQGLFQGYQIDVEPNDSECRSVKLSISFSRQIEQITGIISIALAVITFIFLLTSMDSIGVFLGEISRFTTVIIFFGSLAALGTSFGLFQLLVYAFLYISKKYNKQKQEMAKLKQEIQAIEIPNV